LRYENIDFELVPILKVNSPAKALNITDLSPLHSIWVNKKTKKLKDDIRLAKQFCKANRLYGAESYIGGFSGYVLEILVAHYGSFENLLKAATKWKVKEVVDPENYYPKKDALFHLNTSKQQSPLIIIDPTDKDRNAAAALSLMVFEKFKKIAAEFVKNPSEKLFEKEEITLQSLKAVTQKKKGYLVYLKVEPLPGKVDVSGAQMVKAFEHINDKLKNFGIKDNGWEWDKQKKAEFYFILDKNELPEFELRAGPPVQMTSFVEDFKKKNKDVFMKEGKLFARIKNEHPKLADFVKQVIKEEYVLERVKKISVEHVN
jgi:tRNA nucleotidyltransferase (CCA-adding enzyme)